MSLFPGIFCTIAVFSLNGEYVVRYFLPNGVFLPCDHELDFLHQLMLKFNQSINQSKYDSFAATWTEFKKLQHHTSPTIDGGAFASIPQAPNSHAPSDFNHSGYFNRSTAA